jgi:tetratricopeptide (TPR) repeat protein
MMAEKLNDFADMEKLLRQVMVLKPDYHHAYNALGYSLAERNQRLPEAKQLIQKALEYAPGDPFISDSLAWVEFRMGNKEERCASCRRPTRTSPTPRSPPTWARCSGAWASATRRSASGAKAWRSMPTTTRCRRRSSAG